MILGSYQFSATSPENTGGALIALQALYVFVPAILGAFVALVIRNHPLTEARHAEILAELKARKDDPVHVEIHEPHFGAVEGAS